MVFQSGNRRCGDYCSWAVICAANIFIKKKNKNKKLTYADGPSGYSSSWVTWFQVLLHAGPAKNDSHFIASRTRWASGCGLRLVHGYCQFRKKKKRGKAGCEQGDAHKFFSRQYMSLLLRSPAQVRLLRRNLRKSSLKSSCCIGR